MGSAVSRAFSTNTGEYFIYFIEERMGNPEIFDYQFGPGFWPTDLRRVFEIVGESLVFDPQLEFDPMATDSAFVRSVSESNMPFEVLVEEWGDPGAGGAVVLPVEVALRDLLFESAAGTFTSRLEIGAELDPERGGDRLTVSQTLDREPASTTSRRARNRQLAECPDTRGAAGRLRGARGDGAAGGCQPRGMARQHRGRIG